MTSSRLALPIAVLAVAIVAAACAGPAGAGPAGSAGVPAPTAAPETQAAPSDGQEAATDGLATPTGGPAATDAPTNGPAQTEGPAPAPVEGWRGMALTDARTGATFSIAELSGRLVAIEPMAAWCSNCLRQQKEARKALERLGSDDVVYISLGVDPGEKAGELARYADDEGFGWTFAVATKDVLRELAKEFGDQVLSPPSTPFILVGPDGVVIEQHFGARGADDLAAVLADNLP
jgi:cytochrome oxidase Cu insertion factor (SCO1/SenC/PrrC family)